MKLIRKYWVSVFIVALMLVIACVAFFSRAAQDRAIASPDRLDTISGRVVIDLNGTVVAFILKGTFVTVDAKPSGEVTSTPVGSVEVDLMKSHGTVVIDGIAVDDREAADQLIAIMTREWRKANPSALTQRRRALRAQP